MATMRKKTPAEWQALPGRPVPVSPDFPVRWANPGQARLLWTLDRQHFPDPLSPLAASLQGPAMAAAFNKAAEQYALPVRQDTLTANTYLYYTIFPANPPPAFVLKTMNRFSRVAPRVVNALLDRAVARTAAKYLERLDPVIARLEEYWAYEWLPELQSFLTAWEAFDLEGCDLAHLVAHLHESVNWIRRAWEIHMLLIFPAYLAMSQFEELYRDCFPGDRPLAAFRLLQGADNSLMESDRALWQLSRQALTLPEVHQALASAPAAGVFPALALFPAGRIFLAELRAFLDQYGRRAHKTFGMDEASWLEEPLPVVKTLQDYVCQPDRDLEAELKTQATAREQAVARARRRLQGLSADVANRFETSLAAAQAGVVLGEEHDYWIDQRAQYELRRVVQAAGGRLAAAGAIARPDDVFYLTLDEIEETALSRPHPDFSSLIEERQAEMEKFRATRPPAILGTVPLMEVPAADPLARAIRKILGDPLAAAAPGDIDGRNELSGRAASPGIARGRARVVHSLATAGRLQPGDILVAEATMPPWTPLFATVSAVVTETGGVLSHTAVVAREYGIPAVVGVAGATSIIHDGRPVEVDGYTGLVRLLD